MNTIKTLAAAGLIASSLAMAPSGAQAQTAAPAAATGSGFDSYRVLAVTAGVIAGAAVATIVTDGLIIPVYAYATGTTAPAMAGAGAGAGMGVWHGATHGGYQLLQGGMRVLGAIGGGFYADSWYTGN